MAEDVLEVVDQDLSSVCLQLIGQSTDKGGASRARLGCQIRQEHLEGPLHVFTSIDKMNIIINAMYFSVCIWYMMCYDADIQ